MPRYTVYPIKELPPNNRNRVEVVRCAPPEATYFGLYRVVDSCGLEMHVADFCTFTSAMRAADAMTFSIDHNDPDNPVLVSATLEKP